MRKFLIALFLVLTSPLVGVGQNPRPALRYFEYYDMTFAYPASLSLLSPNAPTGEPVILTSFGGNYGHGGIVPRSGVEVVVLRQPKEGRSLAQIIAEQTREDRVILSSSTQFNGNLSFKVVTDIDFGAFKMRRTAIYFDRGVAVYQIAATYYSDDGNAVATEKLVADIFSTVIFR